MWSNAGMSLEALKREAAALDDEARRELCAFLISLRERQWEAHLRSLAPRLNDPVPDRWLTLEEVRARLEKIPEPSGE